VVSQTLEINLVSLMLASISLLFLLKFDLTLGVILIEYIASSCSTYFYMLYSVFFASRKLIGP
jgi:hypothetical protein